MHSTSSFKAILIDDELHCIETLRFELELNCPEVEVIDTASSGNEGITKIQSLKPDLVFLDIEMPRMSGFEMLRQLEALNFAVIFVTAYDQYALQAFRCAATDYLLKPVDSAQLMEAVRRIATRSRSTTDQTQTLEALLYNIREGLKSPRIALPSGRGIEFVEAADILYCSAEGNYTNIIMTQNRRYILSKTLKDVELMLSRMDFFRVHASYLINFNFLTRYLRDDGGYAVMSDGEQIPISKRRREEFLSKMKVNN